MKHFKLCGEHHSNTLFISKMKIVIKLHNYVLQKEEVFRGLMFETYGLSIGTYATTQKKSVTHNMSKCHSKCQSHEIKIWNNYAFTSKLKKSFDQFEVICLDIYGILSYMV